MVYIYEYKKYAIEHNDKINWTDEKQAKYSAFYNYTINAIEQFKTYTTREQGTTYFTSSIDMWAAVEKIGEENFKKYVLGVQMEG